MIADENNADRVDNATRQRITRCRVVLDRQGAPVADRSTHRRGSVALRRRGFIDSGWHIVVDHCSGGGLDLGDRAACGGGIKHPGDVSECTQCHQEAGGLR